MGNEPISRLTAPARSMYNLPLSALAEGSQQDVHITEVSVRRGATVIAWHFFSYLDQMAKV
jgi:hypothetical protein